MKSLFMRTAGELRNFRRIMQMCICCEVARWIMSLCKFDLKRKTILFCSEWNVSREGQKIGVYRTSRVWCIGLFWCLQSDQQWETDCFKAGGVSLPKAQCRETICDLVLFKSFCNKPSNNDGYFTTLLICKTFSRHVLSRIASVVIKKQMSFYLLFHRKSLIIFVLRHCPSWTACHNHLQRL